MVRMQIQFTAEQGAELRYQARKRGISIAAFVRDAVDRELSRHESHEEAWARAMAAVGSGRGGGGHIGRDHDEYLADAYAGD